MTYRGSCHCGRIAFEVEGTLDGPCPATVHSANAKALSCGFVPRDNLNLLTAEEDTSAYTFNKHVIKHRFCPVCGTHPYGRQSIRRAIAWPPSTFAAWRRSNLASIPVTHFDGRSRLTRMALNLSTGLPSAGTGWLPLQEAPLNPWRRIAAMDVALD